MPPKPSLFPPSSYKLMSTNFGFLVMTSGRHLGEGTIGTDKAFSAVVGVISEETSWGPLYFNDGNHMSTFIKPLPLVTYMSRIAPAY